MSGVAEHKRWLAKNIGKIIGAEPVPPLTAEQVEKTVVTTSGQVSPLIEELQRAMMTQGNVPSLQVTVPAATAETAGVTDEVVIGTGRIVEGHLTFPNGCNGQVYARLKLNGTIILPSIWGATTALRWIALNDVTMPYEMNVPILMDRSKLVLEVCAPLTANPHTISAQVAII